MAYGENVVARRYSDPVAGVTEVATEGGLSSVLNESIAALHEVNARLSGAADRISGTVPRPSSQAGEKRASEPTLLELSRTTRELIGQAHSELLRIERAL